ncbi:MAG: hypothetical protein PHD48_06990 [Alphaproteobacteria bacterium]|nr:hypothetical protein [Alphaproteobacteria bacterium]
MTRASQFSQNNLTPDQIILGLPWRREENPLSPRVGEWRANMSHLSEKDRNVAFGTLGRQNLTVVIQQERSGPDLVVEAKSAADFVRYCWLLRSEQLIAQQPWKFNGTSCSLDVSSMNGDGRIGLKNALSWIRGSNVVTGDTSVTLDESSVNGAVIIVRDMGTIKRVEELIRSKKAKSYERCSRPEVPDAKWGGIGHSL